MLTDDMIVQACNSRLEGMRTERMSWWSHWDALSKVFQPRRYRWFVSPNQLNRGAQQNQDIIDETGLLAARTLAAGMLSGLTSPTKPWFRLGFEDLDLVAYGPVKSWLAEVERRMLRVFAGSNYYQSMAVFYLDEVIFGSSSKIIYEDSKDVIRCYNPCLGEFFFGQAARGSIDTHYREFTYTIAQTVAEFDEANCSDNVRQLYQSGGGALGKEIVICHAIEPNEPFYQSGVGFGYIVSKRFPYRELYWEQGRPAKILRRTGFHECPFTAGRWLVSGNDAYGSCPGMDALPAVLQLQQEQKRKAEAIDKLARPPMVASISMKNEPKSILPGQVTYVTDPQNNGFKPAFEIRPEGIQAIREDLLEVSQRVGKIFFTDLFMMISQLDTVRTATEIDARREEKLILLGPVVERNENEVLDHDIDRVFGIMSRRGLLPEAPPEIAGAEIQVQYISMLAEAQRAASAASIERVLATAGNLAAAKPEILDKVNFDIALEHYADKLSVDPEIIVPQKLVDLIRARRAEQQQAQQLAEATLPATQAAKTLSETPVGGADNALGLVMGNA